MIELREIYESNYASLWDEFITKIDRVDVNNCPEPHLPVCGSNYEDSTYKIAFVGIETGGACALGKYKAIDDLPQIIDDWKGVFDDLMANGAWKWNFWRFIFQFLADFYNEDLHEFKIKGNDLKAEVEKILNSFLWANTSSIERFHITAEKKKVSRENWEKVKDASKVFDKAENILAVFKPNVLILLNWAQASEDWFPQGMDDAVEIKELPLRYYFIKDYNTHLYWTYHPRAMNNNFSRFSLAILEDIKERKIFENFPGEKFLEKRNQEKKILNILKGQLKHSAKDLNLQTIDDEWGFGGESYFYFELPNFKSKISICFGFDKGYDYFSVGVRMSKLDVNYDTFKKQISSILLPIIGEDKNYANWLYLHYYTDDLKNWSNNPKIWDGIKNNETCERLMNIVRCIDNKISEIQK